MKRGLGEAVVGGDGQLAGVVGAEPVEGLAILGGKCRPPRGPEGRNSQLVLGLDDALRGKVGRGAGVVHERAEAGEERRVRLHGQGLVRVVAVLVEDGAKLLHDVEPAVEQRLHVGRNAVGRAVDEDFRAALGGWGGLKSFQVSK